MPRLLSHPYLLLTLTVLFWSGNMVTGRGLREDVPPILLALLRWLIALALTLPFAWPRFDRSQLAAMRRGWLAMVVLGLLGVGGFNTFAYLALQQTTATNASLLNSFIPIVTIALTWGFLGRRLRQPEAIGVFVSMAGVLLIVAHGSLDTLFGLRLNVGDLWMLVAVLTWALYTVGLQYRPAGLDPMVMLAAFTLVGLVALIPAAAVEFAAGARMTVTTGSLLGVLYTGIFPGFLGYVFYNRGVAAVGANRGSLFIHLMPAFGTGLAALFLGERPAWYHLVGIAMIFAGIFLNTRRSP
ncbi:MAG: DMT family transporter [Rhodocyclaceae bacterium]|nr:DMT family transporter [Rhodocyclaceae bacterium]